MDKSVNIYLDAIDGGHGGCKPVYSKITDLVWPQKKFGASDIIVYQIYKNSEQRKSNELVRTNEIMMIRRRR